MDDSDDAERAKLNANELSCVFFAKKIWQMTLTVLVTYSARGNVAETLPSQPRLAEKPPADGSTSRGSSSSPSCPFACGGASTSFKIWSKSSEAANSSKCLMRASIFGCDWNELMRSETNAGSHDCRAAASRCRNCSMRADESSMRARPPCIFARAEIAICGLLTASKPHRSAVYSQVRENREESHARSALLVLNVRKYSPSS
eukprot:6736240-Prymnesium_polylepis.2